MRALIVDDEPLARDGIRLLLGDDAEVTEIGEARNGKDAIAKLSGHSWDVVFLDVQMPEVDGFGVVDAIGADNMPAIVFVTAHDRFAIRAFEINAIDYLQKPVTRERFARAFARVKARRAQPKAQSDLVGLLETLAAARKGVKRLAVKTAGKTELVDVDDIDWIEAAENYVQLHVGKTTHLLHVTLTALADTLDPTAFMRVHRSIIVRVDRIKSLEPTAHGEFVITLSTGAAIRSGRTYADKLRALADNPF
jgi:two-component system LytT family response regulator